MPGKANKPSGAPRPPRRGCKSAAKWKAYYGSMAAWYQDIADGLAGAYQSASDGAKRDAERFRGGVEEIENGTHPNIVAGIWK